MSCSSRELAPDLDSERGVARQQGLPGVRHSLRHCTGTRPRGRREGRGPGARRPNGHHQARRSRPVRADGGRRSRAHRWRRPSRRRRPARVFRRSDAGRIRQVFDVNVRNDVLLQAVLPAMRWHMPGPHYRDDVDCRPDRVDEYQRLCLEQICSRGAHRVRRPRGGAVRNFDFCARAGFDLPSTSRSTATGQARRRSVERYYAWFCQHEKIVDDLWPGSDHTGGRRRRRQPHINGQTSAAPVRWARNQE